MRPVPDPAAKCAHYQQLLRHDDLRQPPMMGHCSMLLPKMVNVIKIVGRRTSVFSVAFSPDGQRIVSGSDDNTLRVWDAATGQPIGAAADRPHR